MPSSCSFTACLFAARALSWSERLPKNVLSDRCVEFTGYATKGNYPARLRLVRYWDEPQSYEFSFLTNTTDLSTASS